MWLPDTNIDSSFADPDNPDHYFLLKIDNEFQNVFKLNVAKGRIFSDEDFRDTGDEIPLILGYDFQKYYNVGDVITDDDGQRYRVVGFLEKLSFYLNPARDSLIHWLDKAFITPLQPDKFDAWEYYSAISYTFVITNNTSNLQTIQEKSNELGLFTFEFRSFRDQLQNLIGINRFKVMVTGFIMTIILIFAIISFISTLV
jgi:hypothetical protein